MIRLSGRLRASLIIGIQGIRARKLRTFLSMISLFLGVLAVVSVQAGSVIAQRALLSDLEMQVGKDGTRQVYLPPERGLPAVAMELVADRSDAVVMTNVPAIIGEPGVRPLNEGGGMVDPSMLGAMVAPLPTCDYNGNCTEPGDDVPNVPVGNAIELSLLGMTGDIREFRPYRLKSGEFLDFDSAPSLAPRIVINTRAAEALASIARPDVALVHVHSTLDVPSGSLRGRHEARFSLVLTKEGGEWEIAAFHNTGAK